MTRHIFVLVLISMFGTSCKRNRPPVIDVAETAPARIDQELEDLKQEKAALEAQLSNERLAHSEKILSLQDDRDNLLYEKSKFEEEIVEVQSLLDSQVDLNQTERASLNFRLITAQAGAKRVEESLEENKEQLEEAHEKIKVLNEEIAALKSKISDLEDRIMELEKELEEEKAKNAVAKSDLNGDDLKQAKIELSDRIRSQLTSFNKINDEIAASNIDEVVSEKNQEIVALEAQKSATTDISETSKIDMDIVAVKQEKDTAIAEYNNQQKERELQASKLKSNFSAWKLISENYPEIASTGAISKVTRIEIETLIANESQYKAQLFTDGA